jgi:hypothetical protein
VENTSVDEGMTLARSEVLRGSGPKGGNPMASTESSAPAPPSTQPKAERLRIARTLALKEAEERYRHELMSDEERLEVLARIKRLQKSLVS